MIMSEAIHASHSARVITVPSTTLPMLLLAGTARTCEILVEHYGSQTIPCILDLCHCFSSVSSVTSLIPSFAAPLSPYPLFPPSIPIFLLSLKTLRYDRGNRFGLAQRCSIEIKISIYFTERASSPRFKNVSGLQSMVGKASETRSEPACLRDIIVLDCFYLIRNFENILPSRPSLAPTRNFFTAAVLRNRLPMPLFSQHFYKNSSSLLNDRVRSPCWSNINDEFGSHISVFHHFPKPFHLFCTLFKAPHQNIFYLISITRILCYTNPAVFLYRYIEIDIWNVQRFLFAIGKYCAQTLLCFRKK